MTYRKCILPSLAADRSPLAKAFDTACEALQAHGCRGIWRTPLHSVACIISRTLPHKCKALTPKEVHLRGGSTADSIACSMVCRYSAALPASLCLTSPLLLGCRPLVTLNAAF